MQQTGSNWKEDGFQPVTTRLPVQLPVGISFVEYKFTANLWSVLATYYGISTLYRLKICIIYLTPLPILQDSCNKFVVPHDVMKFSEGRN